jgi:hypothetical protein
MSGCGEALGGKSAGVCEPLMAVCLQISKQPKKIRLTLVVFVVKFNSGMGLVARVDQLLAIVIARAQPVPGGRLNYLIRAISEAALDGRYAG